MNTMFTVEESNLICVFSESGAGILKSKNEVIEDIKVVLPYLDDPELKVLFCKVIFKLRKITDSQFEQYKWIKAE